MAELPECYRPLADRQGLIPVGALPVREVRRALKTSLSTMDAAIRLFNALVDRLGAAAYVDPAAAAPGRRLHLRDRDDPSWLVPQPLIEIRPMEHVRGGTLAMIRTGPDIPSEDRPEGWQPGDPPWFPKPPLPEIVPRGPTMFAGALLLREGPATIEIRYDERGVLCESTVSGGDSFWAVRAPGRLPFMIDPSSRGASVRPHSLLCRGDLHDHLAADELAAMLAETEQPSRVGFRVWLPVPLPHGPAGVLEGARRGIRAALAEASREGDRVCVVDGFAGTARAPGPDLATAMERWQKEVWRLRPGHVAPGAAATPEVSKPDDNATDVDDGNADDNSNDNLRVLHPTTQRVELGRIRATFEPVPSAVELPAMTPAHTPAARIALPDASPSIPDAFARAGFSRWVLVVDAHGEVAHALLREEVDRRTLIGEGALDLVDPTTLDAQIDEEVAAYIAETAEIVRGEPEFEAQLRAPAWHRFAVWDATRQRAVFRHASSSTTSQPRAGDANGDPTRWGVSCWLRRPGDSTRWGVSCWLRDPPGV